MSDHTMTTSHNTGLVASLQRRVGGIVSMYILLQLTLAPLLYPHGYTGQLFLLAYLAYHVCYRQPSVTINSSNATMKEMILQLLEVTIVIFTIMDLFFAHQQRPSSPFALFTSTTTTQTTLADISSLEEDSIETTICYEDEQDAFAAMQSQLSENSGMLKERTFSEFFLRLGFLMLHMYYSDRIQGIVGMIFPNQDQEADHSSSSALSPMVTLFLVLELILSPYLYPLGYLAQLALLLFLIAYFVLCDSSLFQQPASVSSMRYMRSKAGVEQPSDEEDAVLHKETYEKVLCKICYMHCIDTIFLPCAHTCCICCTEAISHSSHCYGNNHGKCPFCNVTIDKKVSIYFP